MPFPREAVVVRMVDMAWFTIMWGSLVAMTMWVNPGASCEGLCGGVGFQWILGQELDRLFAQHFRHERADLFDRDAEIGDYFGVDRPAGLEFGFG